MRNIFKFFEKVDARMLRILSPLRCRRVLKVLVGMLPVAGSFVMECHCGFLIIGWHFAFASMAFKLAVTWFMFLTICSAAFHFCWVHRAFCLFNYLVGACGDFDKYIFDLGEYKPLAYIATFALGLFLFVAFARHKCWKEYFRR